MLLCWGTTITPVQSLSVCWDESPKHKTSVARWKGPFRGCWVCHRVMTLIQLELVLCISVFTPHQFFLFNNWTFSILLLSQQKHQRIGVLGTSPLSKFLCACSELTTQFVSQSLLQLRSPFGLYAHVCWSLNFIPLVHLTLVFHALGSLWIFWQATITEYNRFHFRSICVRFIFKHNCTQYKFNILCFTRLLFKRAVWRIWVGRRRKLWKYHQTLSNDTTKHRQ